jgi:hypothetical protein
VKIHVRQLSVCLGLGVFISVLPLCIAALPGNSNWLDRVQQASSLLLLPSFPLEIVLSQGNIHDSNLWVMGVFNCAFYTALFYVLVRWLNKRRSRVAGNS